MESMILTFFSYSPLHNILTERDCLLHTGELHTYIQTDGRMSNKFWECNFMFWFLFVIVRLSDWIRLHILHDVSHTRTRPHISWSTLITFCMNWNLLWWWYALQSNQVRLLYNEKKKEFKNKQYFVAMKTYYKWFKAIYTGYMQLAYPINSISREMKKKHYVYGFSPVGQDSFKLSLFLISFGVYFYLLLFFVCEFFNYQIISDSNTTIMTLYLIGSDD